MTKLPFLTRIRLIAPSLTNMAERSDDELATSLRQMRALLAAPVILALVGTALGGVLGIIVFSVGALAGLVPVVLSRQIVAELNARDQFRAEQAERTEAALLTRLAAQDAADTADDDDADDDE